MNKNWVEWTVFVVGLALVAAVVGLLVRDASEADSSPPNIRIEVGRTLPRPDHYAVHVTMFNEGGTTAEGVMISGTLKPPGKAEETAEVEIAFLPRRSQREGWLVFESDPREGELKVLPVGYEKP